MDDEWQQVERVSSARPAGAPNFPSGTPSPMNPQDGWQTVPVSAQGYGTPPQALPGYPVYPTPSLPYAAPPGPYGAVVPRKKSHTVRNVVLIALAFVLLGMAGCGALVYKGMTLLRDSVPTQLAVHTAESSPFVRGRIGTPLKPSWFISGNINSQFQNGVKTGSANLKINVTGPQGEGTLLANETLTASGWKIVSLKYQDAGSASTPLIEHSPEQTGPRDETF